MKYTIGMTDEYEEWFNNQTFKSIVQIAERIRKIEYEGYFGDHKSVGENIYELRWKSGRRIYYAIIPISQVLLLLGGNKNGQNKDIKEAEKIYNDWTN
jgi:putative addiction module killer protein